MDLKNSKYFSVRTEMTYSRTAEERGLDNMPKTDEHKTNIQYTACRMDMLRELTRHPIIVHSWYRAPEVNKAVGGKPNSRHARGLAVDSSCPEFGDVEEYWEFIKTVKDRVRYHKNIYELNSRGQAWVHLSFAEQGQEPALRDLRLYPK